MHVLIVDDDARFREFLTLALGEAGIDSTATSNASEARSVLEERSFDLLMLDVQMPETDGWQLLEELRDTGNQTPVIYLSGKKEVDAKVRGLQLGADDYLVKPVEARELVARVHAILRRHRSLEPMEFGDLVIDVTRRRVERSGTTIELSPREYDLLVELVRSNGEVLSRSALLKKVWGLDFDPGTNVIDVHIGRLRRKLDRAGPPIIQTVRGQGYRAVRRSTDE